MKTHVAVLKGGLSAEREVSLISGAAAAHALRERAYRVTEIDVGHDIAQVLAALRPDVVFNALHGRFGEDGRVQGILETLRLPYTHSGVLASALAMDKPAAKRLFALSGIPTPEGVVVSRAEAARGRVLPPPYVIKPTAEGSSVGVTIVAVGENAPPLNGSWQFGEQVLVERYVPGREITVAVMGERVLGVIEIEPKARFYTYDAKYVEGGSRHIMPAPLPAADYAEAERLALAAHRVLGCRGVSRADLRYDDTQPGGPALFLLEVNTQPGMTPLSLVPEIAAHAGIGFADLVCWMVEDAGCDR
ncbi:MAG: D-alanine--D-alanine ligase, partial [Alphaproteobacteria bacterium]|nr:D-alanine--D-alanine ligase [Alphaproteobacteria bacterium]